MNARKLLHKPFLTGGHHACNGVVFGASAKTPLSKPSTNSVSAFNPVLQVKTQELRESFQVV